MSPTTAGIVGIGLLFLLLFAGVPIGAALALIGFGGFTYLVSVQGGLNLVGKEIWGSCSMYSLSVIPLFVLMGQFAFYAGISQRLYDTAYKWLGHQRGGLALATIGACAGFSAVCGSSLATAATMGTVALPEMKRYKYDPKLATGCIAGGGTLGILIPPSICFMVYGIITEQSIGTLFIAGILPGILLLSLFLITVYIMCRLNPSLGPRGPAVSWKGKLVALGGVWEMLALFLLVMGGLFIGFFTPTEAGAVGALGALLLALARRQISWQALTTSLGETMRVTCMIFFIIIGAIIFSRFLAVSRIPAELASLVAGLPVPRHAIVVLILFSFLLLGCILESTALILLTVPIFFPIIIALGFDPIWFGVILTLAVEMGLITPPVGLNVFVLRGVAQDVSMYTIFRGIVPFLVALMVCIIILVAFPQISLFLPGIM